MKTYTLFVFGIIFFQTTFLTAQTPETAALYEGKTTYFVEYAGMGSTLISVHYDKLMHIQRKHYIGYSIGLGLGDPDTYFDEDRFSIPIAVNYTTGLRSHHFEMGGGLTYLYAAHKSGMLIGFKFGYKYQTKHFYFRVSSAPSGYIVIFTKELNNGSEYPNTDLYNNLFGVSVGFSLH